MKFFSRSSVVLAIHSLLFLKSATADVMTLHVQNAIVDPGSAISLGVYLTDPNGFLPDGVGAFSITLGFSTAVALGTDVHFNQFLGDPQTEAITGFDLSQPGSASFFEVSLLAIPNLLQLQAGRTLLNLARLDFQVTNAPNQNTAVNILSFDLSDANGNPLNGRVLTDNGSISTVPEPTAVLLLGTVIAAVLWKLSVGARTSRLT